MADSTLIIQDSDLTTLADSDTNDPTEVDDNFTNVKDRFNTSLDTTTGTGHDHDGVNSALPYGGLADWNMEDVLLAIVCNTFNYGGI